MSNMTGEVSTKASVGGIEKTITVITDICTIIIICFIWNLWFSVSINFN